MLTPNTLVHSRYLVARQVSGGRAGGVYETIDLQTRAPVILKQVLVAGEGSTNAGLPRRDEVERAARVLAALRHPSLPVVRDHFAEGESVFLAIELVPGEDLATVLERESSPFPADRVLRWTGQLLDALEYIHTLQPPLIHADIRPQNLKLKRDDQIVLLGFGLPRGAPPAARGATAGSGASTSAPFVPPEQARGARPNQRGDLFALVATMYYLLARVPPVPAEERTNIMAHGLLDPLPALHAFNPQVPPAVSAALMQALALDPRQRPASAAALRAALEQAHLEVPHHPPSDQKRDTAVLPETLPAHTRRRGLMFAIIGAVAVALLLAALAQRGSIFGSSATVEQPTSNIPVATAIPHAPAIDTSAARTTIPPTLIVDTSAARTATARTATATTDRRPTPQVSSVEPQSAFVGALPLVLILRGALLDQVDTVRLVAEGRAPIDTALQPADASQLTLSVAALPEPVEGAVGYRLELDGVVLEAPEITLRDFVERKIVRGVLPQYDYTGRVASDATGAYTRMRAESNVDSTPSGPLRNKDSVEILRDDMDGWYRVRIRSSTDSAQVGTTGWVERWLVDNQDVPAKPALLVFTGRVYSAPTDAAVQCGAAFDSSIYGGVEDANGRGISGARVRITSADGHNTYNVTTGRGGVYSVPGLGCTTWTVRLISVPSAPAGIQANPVTVRNLNGGRFTSAEVRFKQQK
jgi:serine/threonine protein kinase